jgi:hypothetical protein
LEIIVLAADSSPNGNETAERGTGATREHKRRAAVALVLSLVGVGINGGITIDSGYRLAKGQVKGV